MGFRPGMTTTHIRFPVVSYRTQRTVECPACGRKRTIARTFEHTINPFNKNKETGEQKTRAEVQADVRAEAQAWEPSGRALYHQKCWEAQNAHG